MKRLGSAKINVIPKRVRDNDNTCLICDETTAEDLISVSEISWGKLSEYGLVTVEWFDKSWS